MKNENGTRAPADAVFGDSHLMSKSILPDAPKLAHTPAPWFIEEDDHIDFFDVSQRKNQEDEDMVCRVYKFMEEGDGKSNATLIAAAPDLLHENNAAAASINALIHKYAGATRLYGGDIESLENELRLIALNLENVARKAKGDAQ